MKEPFPGLYQLELDAERRRSRIYVAVVTLVVAGVMLISWLLGRSTTAPSAQAAQPVTPVRQVTVEGWMRAVGDYQELTLDTTTAQELTVPSGAHLVWIQAGGNNIRYRLDDTDPTTSVGFVLYAGDYMLPPGLIYHMRFISESGTATLRAQPIGM